MTRRQRLVATFVVLNTIDALLTSYIVGGGLSFELNPLMAALLEHSVGTFLLVKVGVVGPLLAALLMKTPSDRPAVFGVVVLGLTMVWNIAITTAILAS
jgi:hypothetical protein